MKIEFKNLEFEIENGEIYLVKFGNITGGRIKENMSLYNFSEAQVSGRMKPSHLGVKMALSSEGWQMKYVSYEINGNVLTVITKTDFIQAETAFTSYDDCNTVRVNTVYKNIAEKPIVLEDASAFCVTGIGKNGIDSAKGLYFYSFIQSHHAECQPRKNSFYDLGLFRGNIESQKRISFANVGSWSTKERLPQGIIYDAEINAYTMFQIESNNSWYYEVGDKFNEYYLHLGGGNLTFNGWSKKLGVGETYKTVNVALSFGNDLNSVIGEMTKYRRHIAYKSKTDKNLPVIFNEYMHFSWEDPNEERTKKAAREIAKTGAKYYVIDCGWHDEVPASVIYEYVGKWRESKTRFPHGLKNTIDYIHSLGLKAGLWIEPEIVGYKCNEMIEYYGDDCFFKRYGEKVCVMRRLFLDFRKEKVRTYLTDTIDYMVNYLGADYIKMDYNQDCGVGTETDAISFGDGLERCADAYLSWADEIQKRFPQVLFETCSSGGMRMDYNTLSHFSIISTSDQVNYTKYPYIAGNILSAVLPEQAAVWSYPVDKVNENGKATEITEEQVIMNMINSFLGRIHLASPVYLLDNEKLSLVYEGIEYYKKLITVKKDALPYFPLGFASFGDETVCSGVKQGDKYYLAIWNLHGSLSRKIKLDKEIKDAFIAYPKKTDVKITFEKDNLFLTFFRETQAVFVEINF